MSNPFDLISNELGIAQGIPREYGPPQFAMQPHAAAAAAAAAAQAAAGQQMLLRGIPSNNGGFPSLVAPLRSSGRASRRNGSSGATGSVGDMSGSGNLTNREKIERRRKREREAARRSRKRKQSRMEQLESQVAALTCENDKLKKQIQWTNVDSLVKERDDIIVKLQRVLEDPSSSMDESTSSLITAFNNITEQIVNLNAKGAESMAASLDKSHLVTVVLWMFISAENQKGGSNSEEHGKDDDDNDNAHIIRKIGSKMNEKIREDIGLDDSQYHAILEARGKYYESFRAAYDQNQQALALVEELEKRRSSMAHYLNVTKSFREHVLGKVLSENQQAKLLVWLHRHKNLLRHLFSSSGAANSSN